MRQTDRVASLAGNLLQERNREKVRLVVIERVFVPQTVTAMQVADVSQLDTGAL
jgi:hypothetical protein